MSRHRILIVDDEELLRLSLQVNLEGEGFEVGVAESAETALAALRKQPYDLLLTDYLMERVDGIELMQQAKKLLPKIKVIVFSGFEDKGSSEKFRALGVDDFFCKPVDLEDLLKRIATILAS
jgi:CheY-like chemotaxis protein